LHGHVISLGAKILQHVVNVCCLAFELTCRLCIIDTIHSTDACSNIMASHKIPKQNDSNNNSHRMYPTCPGKTVHAMQFISVNGNTLQAHSSLKLVVALKVKHNNLSLTVSSTATSRSLTHC
jgi:hypothetical protein